MSEELKPCPFCGGEAVKNSCAVAECKSCRSPVGCRACSIWKDSIDEWNTRVDDDENLSQYLGDLTAKLKLAVEAINLTRIGLEGEVHHSKDIKTSHHCREMLQRLDSCLAKIGEQR